MSCSWLEFRWLDTSYSWLHPTADSSSGGWIWLKANSILWLTMSCGWLELRLTRAAADSSSGGSIRVTADSIRLVADSYFNISSKFKDLFCKLYHFYGLFSTAWFQLPLIQALAAASRTLKKLEEAWRSFKTLAATDSSCSSYSSCDGWFETSDQSTTFRILTPMPPAKKHW